MPARVCVKVFVFVCVCVCVRVCARARGGVRARVLCWWGRGMVTLAENPHTDPAPIESRKDPRVPVPQACSSFQVLFSFKKILTDLTI